MQPASAGQSSSGGRAWRRWGPIAAIVAVVAVVAGVLVATSGGDDDGDDAAPSTSAAAPAVATDAPATTAADTAASAPASSAPGSSAPGSTAAPSGGGEITYPLSFSDAEEQGIEVAWDERCDTERGTIAVPDYFAPECYAPFEGDNGGATAPGVTADSIKVVYYLAQEEDPIINYITDAINSDDTIDQQIETMQNVVRYYQTYYETYGRTVELIPFVATGGAADEVAARADAVRIAEEIQPFVVWQGPGADTGVRRRAGRPWRDVHLVRAGPADRVLPGAGAVRVGDRRQPAAEAGPRLRVRQQAAHRQAGVACRRGAGVDGAQVRVAVHRDQRGVDRTGATHWPG